jgi:hypothetical protein
VKGHGQREHLYGPKGVVNTLLRGKSDLGTPFGATHTGSTGAPSVAATKTSTIVSKTKHIAGARASCNLYQSDRTSVRGSRSGQPKNITQDCTNT